MEFLLLPSLLLLLLHAGAIRIWEHQEDRIFGIPVFKFGYNILRSSRGPSRQLGVADASQLARGANL